jgi:hypothetical protein
MSETVAPEGTRLMCVTCLHRIKPGQLYVRHGRSERHGNIVYGSIHVACPTEREVAHAERIGREP